MKDTNLVNALREHADWWENGDMMDPLGGLEKDLLAAADRIVNQSTHIAALQKEIEKLRGQLKAYEDTWLTPAEIDMDHEAAEQLRQLCRNYDLDRLEKLAEADRAGRLVVLPCKVGDTVYFRTYDCNGTVDLGIQPHKVTAIVGHAIVRGGYTDVGLSPGQYGVSWFLTREQAERALEAIKNE